MTQNESAKLGTTTTDIVTSLAKGTTGAIPIVGSMIAEIIGNVIPNQRVERIVRFVKELEDRLGKLEAENLQAKVADPAVVDLLEDAFIQASRATSEDRITHIAEVIANGITSDELNEAEVKRMLWLLGQLNDAEIVILRSRLAITREDMQSDSAFREQHAMLLAPDATHLGSTKDKFEEAARKASYRQHLHDLGLLRHRYTKPKRGELPDFDEKTGMMTTSGSDVTRLGQMFLCCLNVIPNWYKR